LYSYGALAHRHVPEIAACARLASGIEAEFNFVPHSGPFARGIHVTVQASLKKADRERAGARDARRVLPRTALRARDSKRRRG
jgi:N-acetyl-gamma-glutamylphosphate reductase